MSEWQPIETAPKDGMHILLCIAGTDYYSRSGWWSEGFGRWVCRENEYEATGLSKNVTHWMPLPEPPASE